MVSLVDDRINDYTTNLATLKQALIDRATIRCSVTSYRVLDIMTTDCACLYPF